MTQPISHGRWLPVTASLFLAAAAAPGKASAIGFNPDTGETVGGATGLPGSNSGASSTASASDALYEQFESEIEAPDGTAPGVEALCDLHEVGGVSIAVVEDGLVSQFHYYCDEDRKKGIRTTANTLYQAASTTKFVSSLTIVEADRQGILDLSRKMTSYADDHPNSTLDKWRDQNFTNAESSYPDDMSLRRLLNHSSGLDTHSIGTQPAGFTKSMKEILIGTWPFTNGVQPLWEPGIAYSYSGGAFTLAEHILELESGDAFKDFATRETLDPLGMTKSTFEDATTSLPNLARGCSRGICLWEVMQTKVKAAGGLLANVNEYGKLVATFMNGGVDQNGVQKIDPENIRTVLKPAIHKDSSNSACSTTGATKAVSRGGATVTETCFDGKYQQILLEGSSTWGDGLGVMVSSNVWHADGRPAVLYHNGSQDGFRAFFRMDRNRDVGIVVMINGLDWKKRGVSYGASTLLSAIDSAFNEVYR